MSVCTFCNVLLEDDLIIQDNHDTIFCPSCFVVFTGNDCFCFQDLFPELNSDRIQKLNAYQYTTTPTDQARELIKVYIQKVLGEPLECFACDKPQDGYINLLPACLECYMKFVQLAQPDKYIGMLLKLDAQARSEVEDLMKKYPEDYVNLIKACIDGKYYIV